MSCLLAALLLAPLASATDTIEPFEVGAVDAEAHLRVGLASADPAEVELVLGGGLSPRLSATVAMVGRPIGDAWTPTLALFGSVLESDHVDFDLGLHSDGGTVGAFAEFNLDLDPEMASVGLWVLASGYATERTVGLAPGVYWTARPHLQLLAQAEFSQTAGRRLDVGANLSLSRRLELVTQVGLPAPAAAVGLIATF